jgi:hypothetical protein
MLCAPAASDYASRDRRFSSDAVSLSNFERGSIGFHASLWSRAALYRASRCSRYLMKRPMTSTDRPRGWKPKRIKYTTSEISLLGNRIHLSDILQCFAFDLAWSLENGFRSKNPGQHCVGTIGVGIRGDAVAYNDDGKRLGCFASATAAASALKPVAAPKP